mmetsp:Transcript_19641/g.34784  ORF Transcript_19641/g.34784 Transcript_19641/m.34784 type:complete len:1082 (-) Transcript_19641:7-3252(-)
MEAALAALRSLGTGACDEAVVFRAAAGVPMAILHGTSGPAIAANNDMEESRDPEVQANDGDESVVGPSDLQLEHGSDESNAAEEEFADQLAEAHEFELYTWGRGSNYQLGFGAINDEQPVPRLLQLPLKLEIQSICCGRFHTLAVTSCSSVLTWGFGGTTSRLGLDGSETGYAIAPITLPEFGPGRHRAVKVAAGCDHSLALTAAGKLLSWGSNEVGQLALPCIGIGEGALQQKPFLLKSGPLKGLRIVDIAAGLAHSLCLTDGSAVWSWGSNAFGATGLGAPPIGPDGAIVVPQQLPHLKGSATYASASSHVSAVIGEHGDAIMFGAKSTDSGPVTDPKSFLPHRVRRNMMQTRKGSNDEEWQMQKSSPSTYAPLCSITIGSEEVFGVDESGILWVWSTVAPRPCSAEHAVLISNVGSPFSTKASTLGFGQGDTSVPTGLKSIGIAERAGTIWAVDNSRFHCMWQLKRVRQAGIQTWRAERSEFLAQVSGLCCGPEHQAAVVSFKRTAEVLKDFSEIGIPTGLDFQSRSPKLSNVRKPDSLQELCEKKLCNKLSPRNFSLLCDLAWELNRPHLVDRAFAFLCDNAALMFSRQYLPVLAQLHSQVLISFELVASGRLAAPSTALAGMASSTPGPWEDLLREETSELLQGFLKLPESSVAPLPEDIEGAKRKKRGGAGNSQAKQVTGTSSVPGVLASPQSPTGMAPTSKSPSSPLAKAKSPTLLQQGLSSQMPSSDWVTVGERRKLRSGHVSPSCLHSHASPLQIARAKELPLASGQSKPSTPQFSSGSPLQPMTKSPHGPKAANPDSIPTHHLPLTTFLRPGRSTGNQAVRQGSALREAHPSAGPSAILAAAMESAHMQSNKAPQIATSQNDPKARGTGKWAMQSVETPANLREILAEEGSAPLAMRSGERFKKDHKKTDEDTKCAWGFEAMPSERPRGKSMYDLQDQEAQEQEQRKAEEDILEIEAMFAALEVAQREEENESLQLSDPLTLTDAKEASKSARKKGSSKGAVEAAGAPRKGRKGGRKGGKGAAQDWDAQEKSRVGKAGKTRHLDTEASRRGPRWTPKAEKHKAEGTKNPEL